jgi:general stress protein YciG
MLVKPITAGFSKINSVSHGVAPKPNFALNVVPVHNLRYTFLRSATTTTQSTSSTQTTGTTGTPFPPPKWAQQAPASEAKPQTEEKKEEGAIIRKGGIRKGGIYKTDEEEAAEAKAKKAKQEEQDTHNILEKGYIYFYYRPKMNIQEAQTLDDVQMLYILLSPKFQASELLPSLEGVEKKKPNYMNRLLTVSKKKLPEINERSRYWAFVAVASKDMNEVNDWLASEKYLTKTRGERELQGSISIGEGTYAVIEHNDHTHLGYVLKSMNDLGELTKAFNIEKEGSYVISIKNPERADPTHYLRDKHKAHFPPELQEQFRGRRFMTAVNPEFLDYKGCEVVVIGAYDDVGVDITM